MKKCLILFILISLLLAYCSSSSGLENAQKFGDSYQACNAKFQQKFAEVREKYGPIRTKEQYQAIVREMQTLSASRTKELSDLLRKYENLKTCDELELLKSKALLDLARFDDAGKIIDRLLQANSPLSYAAKFEKIKILLTRREFAKAAQLFDEVKTRVQPDVSFYNILLTLAFNVEGSQNMEKYCLQYMQGENLPAEVEKFRPYVQEKLANLARERGDYANTQTLLRAAIQSIKDDVGKKRMEMELRQMELIGHKSIPIMAENWFNSRPLDSAKWRGKVVLLNFWAPWCEPCRRSIPMYNEQFQQLKDKGLLIIACTKLYGFYSDDTQKKEKVTASEEITLIKAYLAKNKIAYPIAVAQGVKNHDDYGVTVLPTSVIIDKKGSITYIGYGAADLSFIFSTIKNLLGVKS